MFSATLRTHSTAVHVFHPTSAPSKAAHARLTADAYRRLIEKFKATPAVPERPPGLPVFQYDRRPGEPENFRSSDAFVLDDSLNATGWDALHVSGSASIASLEQVYRLRPSAEKPVLVVDLREESHAIVGGHPCTWRSAGNWSNVGRSRSEVLLDEQSRVDALRHQDRVEILHPRDAGRGLERPRKVVLMRPSVFSEAELVRAIGGDYLRLMVTDHLAPRPDDVDLFISTVRQWPSRGRVHIHCDLGLGRTGLFIAMHDMLKNAHAVPFEDLIERQLAFNPGLALDFGQAVGQDDFTGKRNDRLDFISLFYEYARQNAKGRPQSWSEWLADPAMPHRAD